MSRCESPFAMVPEWLLYGTSANALRLWSALWRHQNGRTGECKPSRETLGRKLGWSVNTVKRAVRELEDAGAVTIERRRRGNRQASNRYTLWTRDPAERATDGSQGPTVRGPRMARGEGATDGPRTRARENESKQATTTSRKSRTSPEARSLTLAWYDACKAEGEVPHQANAVRNVMGMVQTARGSYTDGEIAEALRRIGPRTVTKDKLLAQCSGIRDEAWETQRREGTAQRPWFQDGEERPPPPTDEKPWWQRGEQAG